MADEYIVQVRMNGGPFKIDSEHKSNLRKSDLTGGGRMGVLMAD